MANTYIPISSSTLGSSQASVTFSSIPNTYTDLYLKISARSDNLSNVEYIVFTLNGTSTGYSETDLNATGASVSSTRGTGNAYVFVGTMPAASNTASIFGNAEVYIPSYTASRYKPVGTFDVAENDSASTGTWIHMMPNLWSNNSAITSIVLSGQSGGNFVSGSSFYLYGIKNS